MPKYQAKLIDRQDTADQTMAFYFEKPGNFEFRAGQYMDVKLIDPPKTDEQGTIRPFSIASSPEENFLMFATRMRDNTFKRVIRQMPLKSEVEIDGPFGSLTLHQNVSRAAVFLAGGIGITPFRSIIFDAAERQLPHKLYLFYSNHKPQTAPFLKELRRVENPNFKFIPTMTDIQNSDSRWTGEVGAINFQLLQKYLLSDMEHAIYYAVGSPPMVAAMYQMLLLAGISPDDIKTEEFSGY